MILGERTSPELAASHAAAASNVVVLVPLGSTEQHGPHLPLDTDTRIAIALAQSAAEAFPAEGVFVAPVLAYGSAGEHAGFAGTISIGQEALELVVIELVRSLTAQGAKTVLVNGHGGNAAVLGRSARRLRREGHAVWLWAPEVSGGDAHAGRTETSLLAFLAPELVRWDRLERGNAQPLRTLMAQLQAGGLRTVSPNGVLGDPTGSSAEEGEKLFEMLIAQLKGVVRAALDSSGSVTVVIDPAEE